VDAYFTPSHTQQFELVIKRSRFISTIAHVNSREQAKAFIHTIKEQYPDASHNCWAFIVGAPDDLYGVDQSDDGEPKHTAGKPMLNVLQHSGIGHVALVVTRYFGGIKLGAGGLVRAYTQSASEAVNALEKREHTVCKNVTIDLPYHFLSKLEYWLKNQSVDIVDKQFDKNVRLVIAVPIRQLPDLQEALNSVGNGDIRIVAD
jgi:uncharacterized YigZ family protein